jgi:hypothetical protein
MVGCLRKWKTRGSIKASDSRRRSVRKEGATQTPLLVSTLDNWLRKNAKFHISMYCHEGLHVYNIRYTPECINTRGKKASHAKGALPRMRMCKKQQKSRESMNFQGQMYQKNAARVHV